VAFGSATFSLFGFSLLHLTRMETQNSLQSYLNPGLPYTPTPTLILAALDSPLNLTRYDVLSGVFGDKVQGDEVATLQTTVDSGRAMGAAAANVDGGDQDLNDDRKMLVRRIGLIVLSIPVLTGIIVTCCLCSQWCKLRGTQLFHDHAIQQNTTIHQIWFRFHISQLSLFCLQRS